MKGETTSTKRRHISAVMKAEGSKRTLFSILATQPFSVKQKKILTDTNNHIFQPDEYKSQGSIMVESQ